MNADRMLATANTRTVALTAKHTAAPSIVVKNSVRKNRKNFTVSSWNPSTASRHTCTVDIFSNIIRTNTRIQSRFVQTVTHISTPLDIRSKFWRILTDFRNSFFCGVVRRHFEGTAEQDEIFYARVLKSVGLQLSPKREKRTSSMSMGACS